MERTADWEVQAWSRWQDPPNSTKSLCLGTQWESSGRGEEVERAGARTESMGRSNIPVEPSQSRWLPESAADESARKRSWSWPSGRGKNRRDSQEPTGGPAHRKGSQTHSRWHSRWRRNMDMDRWAGHHLRRSKEDTMWGEDGRWAGHSRGLGPWDRLAGICWSSLTAGAVPRMWRPGVPKYSLLIQIIDLFLKVMAWDDWNNIQF